MSIQAKVDNLSEILTDVRSRRKRTDKLLMTTTRSLDLAKDAIVEMRHLLDDADNAFDELRREIEKRG